MHSRSMLRLVALIGFVASASTMAVIEPRFQYNTCGGSTLGEVKNASFSPVCDTQCPMVRGTDVNITVHFLAYASSSRPKVRVTGTVGGIPSQWLLTAEQEDVCNSLTDLKCPITANLEYTMKLILHVDAAYPAVKITMTVEIYDFASVKNIACISFPAVIT
jgi:hypothetical protein